MAAFTRVSNTICQDPGPSFQRSYSRVNGPSLRLCPLGLGGARFADMDAWLLLVQTGRALYGRRAGYVCQVASGNSWLGSLLTFWQARDAMGSGNGRW